MLLFLDLYTIIIDIFIHDDLSFVRAEEKYCLTKNLFFKTNQSILAFSIFRLRPPIFYLYSLSLSVLPKFYLYSLSPSYLYSLSPSYQVVLSLLPLSVLPKFYLYSLSQSYQSFIFTPSFRPTIVHYSLFPRHSSFLIHSLIIVRTSHPSFYIYSNINYC